jgi:hypothetical protein
MTTLTRTGRRVSRNPAVRIGARVGLVARGIVWALMGVVALQIAAGSTSRQADQQGALAAVATHSGGRIVLAVIAIGLASYALWRLSLAVFGTSPSGDGAGTRAADAIRAVSYGALCATAVSVLTGSTGSSQDARQAGLSAQLMQNTAGRLLLGAVGLVIAGAGVYFVWQGIRADIFEHLDRGRVPAPLRPVVVALGVGGNTARGLVITLAGVLVVVAAVTVDPHRATGLDGALRTLAHNAYGPWLIGIAGVGLLAFGVFAVAEAVWSQV